MRRIQRQRRQTTAGIILMILGLSLLAAISLAVLRPPAPPSPGSPAPTPAGPLMAGSTGVQPTLVLPTPLPAGILAQQAANTIVGKSSTPVDSEASRAGPNRLVIPALGIDAPVRPVGLVAKEDDGKDYYTWAVPNEYAAGWHEASAGLGQSGNTVLNGHNNVYGAIFRDLAELPLGAQIILSDPTGEYTYEVIQQEYVEEDDQSLKTRAINARWILPTSDERITIVTCWPYVRSTHRLVVIAKPITLNGS